jgi:hypothetical protein
MINCIGLKIEAIARNILSDHCKFLTICNDHFVTITSYKDTTGENKNRYFF